MSINTPVPRTNLYPVQQSPTPALQTPALQTPGRERLNDQRFTSLAELVEVEDRHSLFEELEMLTLRTLQEKHPQADAIRLACAAILTLDEYDHVADHDQPTLHLAAKLLLDLRQPLLLQRLAAVTGHHFVLDVGTNQSHADVLARIGDAWPKNVPVSLVLDTSMSADAASALSTFLRCTSRLNVQIHAQKGASSPSAASAFGQALKACSLEELSIVSGPLSVGVLQAMVGVHADVVAVLADRAHGEDPGQGTALHDALSDLVRQSGACALNIAGDSGAGALSEGLAAKLLGCRVYWVGVQLKPGMREAEIMQRLVSGQHTIGELKVSGRAGEFSMAGLIHGARMSRVHTIVFLHDADVISLAESLHRRLMMSLNVSPHLFERIEACLTYKAVEHERATLAVSAILANPVLITLQHRPGGVVGDGRVVIGPVQASAIEGSGASSRLASLPERLQRLSGTQRRMMELILTLGRLLIEDRPLANLMDFLRSPTNTLIPASSPVVPSGNWQPLEQKIRVLDACLVDKRFVRGGISVYLNKRPVEMHFVCQALARIGFPRQDLPGEEWKSLGKRYLERHASNSSSLFSTNANAREDLALMTDAFLNVVNAPFQLGSAQTLPPMLAAHAGERPSVIGILTVLVPNTSEELIVTALGRALATCKRGHADLVEGLAFVGVIPPGVWLSAGLGIDIESAGQGS